MTFFSILRLREVFVIAFDYDEGPQQLVAVADDEDPGLLGGKTVRRMKVLYHPFDAR